MAFIKRVKAKPSGRRPRLARAGRWFVNAALEPASGHIKPETVRRRKFARAYGIGLVITSVLIALAMLNNQAALVTAFVIAILIGLSYPAITVHRSGIATVLVMLWWVGTAPLIAALTGFVNSPATGMPRFVGATNTVVLIGILVSLMAVLMRARRPWLTIAVSWGINLVGTAVAALAGMGLPAVIGWALVTLYLVWRSGAPSLLIGKVRDRSIRDQVMRNATDVQREVFERLAHMRKDIPVLYLLKPPPDFGGSVAVDALVVGPTGVFGVYAVDALGRLQVNVSNKRRIAVEQRGIDSYLYDVARSAHAIGEALRVEVTPIGVMVGATFPSEYPGIIRLATQPAKASETVDLTLLDPDLLLDRIYYGDNVYSTGQQATISRRARIVLRTAYDDEKQPADASGDSAAGTDEAAVLNDLAEIFSSRESAAAVDPLSKRTEAGADRFYPGMEVVWEDSAGQWEGWVCTTGVVPLDQVPELAVDQTLRAGDEVVWIVAKAEWDRASADRREPDEQLTQPVRPADLTAP